MTSKYFRREEFACKCRDDCGYDIVDTELLEVLEDIRETFEAPVKINSGCRCGAHNYRIGGRTTSQHLYGKAADIVVEGYSPADIHRYLDNRYPDEYGLGKYPNFTHIDVRNYKARWEA